MMRLLCNGVALDLYENTKLQFKKKNTMFSFGDMSSERTTQFKLPCTPKNDRAFALARIPAYSGDAMRKQYPAQLQNGLSVSDGLLHISEFDGKDYAAVFVGGFAYDLKAWNNSKWGEVLLPMDYGEPDFDYSQPKPWPYISYDANDPKTPMIARVKYHFDNESDTDFGTLMMGSIHLEKLFTALTQQGLFKITGLVGENIRLIRNDHYGFTGVLERLANVQSYANYLDIQSRNQVVKVLSESVYPSGSAPFFHVAAGTKITFPADTPANLCIVYQDFKSGPNYGQLLFAGSRKFDFDGNGDPYYYGEPLAGQTVVIPTENFLLIDASGAHPVLLLEQKIFFNFADGGMGNVPTYDLAVRVEYPEPDNSDEYADYYAINDHSMLMGLSLADLIKAYAAITGRLICMRRDGSIEFVTNFGAQNVELKNIESRKNVARTFSNFAQHNFVEFKSDSAVKDWERIRTEYVIENANLEEEKTILQLAYIEGGQFPEQVEPFTRTNPLKPIPDNVIMYIRDTEKGYWGFDIPAETLALAGTDTHLQRVAMPKIDLLQDLCDKSTRYKIRVRMTYTQYNAIDGDTSLLIEGTRYTWIEANYGDGTAEITLQKIE